MKNVKTKIGALGLCLVLMMGCLGTTASAASWEKTVYGNTATYVLSGSKTSIYAYLMYTIKTDLEVEARGYYLDGSDLVYGSNSTKMTTTGLGLSFSNPVGYKFVSAKGFYTVYETSWTKTQSW